jgi:hypothetical protein
MKGRKKKESEEKSFLSEIFFPLSMIVLFS